MDTQIGGNAWQGHKKAQKKKKSTTISGPNNYRFLQLITLTRQMPLIITIDCLRWIQLWERKMD